MRRDGLVHVGVAVLLAAAVVSVVGLVQSAGAAGGGTASVYVPIEPCRLADTRSGTDHVGVRASPIGAAESVSFQVTGTNGNCTIPSSATGIASNVTAVNPTAPSYLTVYPADADPRPVASNLNYNAGSPPTPNQVTVGLSAGGAIAAFNNAGTVDVIVDIVGYYTAASGGGAPGPTCPAGGCVANYLGHDAVTSVGSMPSPVVDIGGCFHVPQDGTAEVSLNLHDGAKPISASVVHFDHTRASSTRYDFFSIDTATGAATNRTSSTEFSDDSTTREVYQVTASGNAPAQSASASFFLRITATGANQIFCAAQVKYTF